MSVGTGAMKGWWDPTKIRDIARRFPLQPWEREPALQTTPSCTTTLKELQRKIINTYLTQYFPWPDHSQDGWEGLGTKFAN